MNTASATRGYFLLEPETIFLNHGSFGACPRPVLEAQTRIQEQMERQPLRFFVCELEPLLDEARRELARFVGAPSDELSFVPNATTGVNTVLHSLAFEPGDELLTTNHEYNACRNALEAVAAKTGARVVVANLPFPLRSASEVVEAVLSCANERTALCLIDHVTSSTGLVLPIREIATKLAARGIDTLVDGAHAPGMLPLDLTSLGVAYYTGNCHKWLCAPKGAAFLYVRKDKQEQIRPLVISHGANSPRTDKSRFQLEFDWTGTDDFSAYLCVPEAIRFMESLLPGGFAAVMEHNRKTALAARLVLCQALGQELPCPDEMIGSLASVPLPDGSPEPLVGPWFRDPLQEALSQRGFEVPIVAFPKHPKRLVRISAQVYNDASEYEKLAAALVELCGGTATT